MNTFVSRLPATALLAAVRPGWSGARSQRGTALRRTSGAAHYFKLRSGALR
jgi:hypothetical protein